MSFHRTAIVLVKQNAREALAMAHPTYVLDTGRDRFSGSGNELLNDLKVAELYLGAGNPISKDGEMGENGINHTLVSLSF